MLNRTLKLALADLIVFDQANQPSAPAESDRTKLAPLRIDPEAEERLTLETDLPGTIDNAPFHSR